MAARVTEAARRASYETRMIRRDGESVGHVSVYPTREAAECAAAWSLVTFPELYVAALLGPCYTTRAAY